MHKENTPDFYEIPEDPNHAKEGLDLYQKMGFSIPVVDEKGVQYTTTEIMPISTAELLYEKLIEKYNGFDPETAPDGEHDVFCGVSGNAAQLLKLKVVIAGGKVAKVRCASFSDKNKGCMAGRVKQCLQCEKFDVDELEFARISSE
jgi:hypothetical protein